MKTVVVLFACGYKSKPLNRHRVRKENMDYSRLKLLIVKMYGTISKFADKIGVSTQFVSLVLTSGRNLNTTTVLEWSDALNIKKRDIGTYFFTERVCKRKHDSTGSK